MNYFNKNKDEIFKKYSDAELVKDINSYIYGNGNLNKTLNHFYEEIIFKSCGKKTKISPMDVLMNDEMVSDILLYIKGKPKFFTGNDIQNIKSFFRNSASWVRKVANFPPKEARNIYFRYNDINGDKLNILDTSSGFGSRMSAVLLSGHNYYGFDPNAELNKILNKHKDFLFKNNLIKEDQVCKLFCIGSENHIKELDGIIDISFTSPPYFNLEKYSDDESKSTENYNNYNMWVSEFVIPTVLNTSKYLKVGGYAMINIKNINKKNTCYDDFFNAFKNLKNMEFIEVFDLNIKSKKQYGMAHNNEKGVISPKEPVMVFRKVLDE